MAREDDILKFLNKMAEDQHEARVESTRAISELDKKVDLHIQKMDYELSGIKALDNVQNTLLDKHIEGVNTLRKIHEEHVKENNARFSQLETPRKFFKGTVKVVIWLGAVGTAALAILQLISYIKGH